MTKSEQKLLKSLNGLVGNMEKELKYQAERIAQIDQSNSELYSLTEIYKELIENYGSSS
jgi:hypothetical protein